MKMAITIRAHYDGKVIVPDQPLDLPVGEELEVELRRAPTAEERPESDAVIEERLRRFAQAAGRIKGPSIPLEAVD
jgi:predicted DNA-binding antitoxin AbrB/MazE fold protein